MKKILLLISLLAPQVAQAIFPIDYLRPYNDNLFRPVTEGQCWSIDAIFEHSFSPKAHTFEGCEVNFLQTCQESQSSLAMIKGYKPTSEIGMLSQQFNVNDDDGIRGHFVPCADLEVDSALITGRYYLPNGFNIVATLPIYSINVSNVLWEELTNNVIAADFLTKDLFTDNFFQNICELGCLDLWDVERTNIGDLYLGMQWLHDFEQNKDWLSNVRTNIYSGMTFPTARKVDVNKSLSIPFGNDGAFGILFGGGIDLTLRSCVRLGVDALFLNLFGSSKCRRIKTFDDQTDLFLLETTKTRKEFGFTQRYNLYAQWYQALGGLSFKAAYQHWRHNDDKLTLFTYDYSTRIANTACSLEEWTLHNFYFFIDYDAAAHLDDCATFKPFISLWYKVPVTGRHSIGTHGFGVTAWFNF